MLDRGGSVFLKKTFPSSEFLIAPPGQRESWILPIMNSRLPIVRKIAWVYTIPHLLIMFALMVVGFGIFSPNDFWRGSIYGVAAYLVYSFGSRGVLLKNHRRGIYFAKLNSYHDAIREFQLSYQFLGRHQWVDKYRFIVMLDSSAVSYREMALCNIAYSHVQLQEPVQALQYYRRALEEFPESEMAKDGVVHVEAEGR
jgi:tetratricopeptide (TPR) repeat protein